MNSDGRTIVLGVDSLDLLLVERWAAQGQLPFLASMLRDSSLVRLSTVSRVLQGALWPSVLTGRSPGHHGYTFFSQLTNGTYNLDLVKADHYPADFYYAHLVAGGVRCAIVDVPNDMPVPGFRGLHVVDWLTEYQAWEFQTQPATSKREIRERYGALNDTGGYGPTIDSLEGHRRLRQKLERSASIKYELMRELLERKDLDHIFVVFAEPHKAGHHLWKYMDPTHPDHVAAEPYLRDALLNIYQLLDTHLAQLSTQLSGRDNLLIFSDHGMQANYRGDQFVGAILDRLGLSAPLPNLRGSAAATPISSTAGAGSRLRRALHTLVRAVAPEFLRQKLRRQFGAASRVDWGQTRVFPLPTDRNSYLRINLRGREPEGIVSSGKEYEELLALIEREFCSLVNADTGKPAVEAVFKVHQLFPGPRVDDLPDIAVLWDSAAPISAVESPRLGRIEMRIREDRSGNHRPEGFLLARGPGIRSQARDLRGDVLQIPGTLLALHGMSCPDHYEMPPIGNLLVAG